MMKVVRKNHIEMVDIRNIVTQMRKTPFIDLLLDLKEPKKAESVSHENRLIEINQAKSQRVNE